MSVRSSALRAGIEVPRPWMGAGVSVLCIGAGLAAGQNPKLGLLAAFGVAYVILALSDLTLGLLAFVVVSFLDIVHFQGGSLPKVAGALLIVSWLATRTLQRPKTGSAFLSANPGYTLVLVVFLLWVGLSALWAEETGPAVVTLTRFGQNIMLMFIVFSAMRDRRHVPWVLGAFVIGALASTAYGLAVPLPADRYGAARLGSGIGEANETATVLVASIVLSIGMFGILRRSRLLASATVFAAFLALAGLLKTLSRAGLLSLGLALVAGIFVGGRWRKYAVALAALTAFGTLGYLVVLAPSAARDRVGDQSSTGRTDLWTLAWRAVQDHPVRGIGAGNFRVSSVHYLVQPGATTRADFIVDDPKAVHNIYLEQLAELGVVGLGLFMLILGLSLRSAFLAAERFRCGGDVSSEMAARAVIVALVGILVADFFAPQQFSKQLWLLLAMGPALLGLARSQAAISP